MIYCRWRHHFMYNLISANFVILSGIFSCTRHIWALARVRASFQLFFWIFTLSNFTKHNYPYFNHLHNLHTYIPLLLARALYVTTWKCKNWLRDRTKTLILEEPMIVSWRMTPPQKENHESFHILKKSGFDDVIFLIY